MLVFGNAPLAVAQNNLPALPTLPEMPSLPPIPSLPAMPELFAPDTLIVKFAENSSTEIKNQTNSQLGGRFFKDLPELDLQIIKVPFGQMEVYMQAYNQNPNVLYAEPDYVATAYGISNDPSLPSQWGLYKIDAAEAGGQSAWDITYGSASVKIAVLDTGIEESHPDLAGKIVGRANFSASASNSDFLVMAPHVAGI
ncbi:MAG: Thermophilic serine proteinase precursor [Bacteroidetes bacterium OLB12]|nr:MAG: Thermophilic serine proteinase precursor [Bacteroidetes bacterium OLB12]